MSLDADHLPRRFATPLDAARSQIGVREQPPGSNRGPPHDLYSLPGEEPSAWCARGLRWCYEQAGQRLPGQRYLIGRVETLQQELDRAGALVALADIRPGDLLFTRRKGGFHVAIVDVVSDGKLNTIDFNYSDAVTVREDLDPKGPDVWCAARWPTDHSS